MGEYVLWDISNANIVLKEVERMFYIMVVIIVFWLFSDYRKDKKIEKCLNEEKEQALNNQMEEDKKYLDVK